MHFISKKKKKKEFERQFNSQKEQDIDEAINLGELLSVCIDAAIKAGEIIREVWKSGKLDIVDKGSDTGVFDPFTIADVQSQQLIMGLLLKKWPK